MRACLVDELAGGSLAVPHQHHQLGGVSHWQWSGHRGSQHFGTHLQLVVTPAVNRMAACTPVDSPVTVLGGLILDSTFHSCAGACLARVVRYDDPRGRTVEQGSWAFSLPNEPHYVAFKLFRMVVQKNVRCCSFYQKWGECFNTNIITTFFKTHLSVICWCIIYFFNLWV